MQSSGVFLCLSAPAGWARRRAATRAGNAAPCTASRTGGRNGLTSTSSRRSWTPSARSSTTSWPCPRACTKEMKGTATPKKEPKLLREPRELRRTSTARSGTCASSSNRWPGRGPTARSKSLLGNSSTDMFVFQIRLLGFWWEPGNTGWWTLKEKCYGKEEMIMS